MDRASDQADRLKRPSPCGATSVRPARFYAHSRSANCEVLQSFCYPGIA